LPIVCLAVVLPCVLTGVFKKEDSAPAHKEVVYAEETGAATAPDSEKGGGLLLKSGASHTMSNGSIKNMLKKYGAAVYIGSGCTFTMNGGEISSNQAKYGGAIYVENGGKCVINGGKITGNKSELGSAIYVEDGGVLEVNDNSVISGNTYDTFWEYSNLFDEVQLKEGKVYLTDKTLSGSLNIPASVNGHAVTEVANGAFRAARKLTKVTLPSSVTRVGSNAFNECDSLEEVVLGDNVDTIDFNAFSSCYSLKRIVIPDSVTVIGKNAFSNCRSLESITLGEGVREILGSTFESCSNLRSITIPDGVTSIAASAFKLCEQLESVYIGKNMTNLGNNAFPNCYSISTIVVDDANPKYDSRNGCNAMIESATNKLVLGCADTVIPNTVKVIEKYAFSAIKTEFEMNIPEGVETIASYAFVACSGLTSLHIPASVTSISPQSFGSCSGLQSITVAAANSVYNSTGNCNAIMQTSSKTVVLGCINTSIPAGTLQIGDYAFANQMSLTSLSMPSTITRIGNYAFTNCQGLTNFNFPTSLTSLGNFAFNECIGLERIELPASVKTIGNSCFKNCIGVVSMILSDELTTIGTNAFENMNELQSVDIPEKVTKIGGNAFNSCTALKSITLPDGLNSLGNYTFAYCTSLTEIVVPTNVSEIGKGLFLGCTALEKVVLPETTRIIREEAFKECESLNQLILPSGTKTIYAYAFDLSNIKALYIPATVMIITGDIAAPAAKIYCEISKENMPVEWNVNWQNSPNVIWNTSLEEFLQITTRVAVGVYVDGEYVGEFELDTTLSLEEQLSRLPYDDEQTCGYFLDDHYGNCAFKFAKVADIVKRYNTFKLYTKLATLDKLDLSALASGNAQYTNNNISGEIVIPRRYNGVLITKIPHHGFEESGISSVIMPSSITSIEGGAFSEDKLRGNVIFPENLKSLGDRVIELHSPYLKTIWIPASVEVCASNCIVLLSDTVTIYCGAASKPSGWEYQASNVKWGYTYEQYLAEIASQAEEA